MNIASYIDHTILKPDTSLQEIDKICQEALENKFAAVCVPPSYVQRAAKNLDGSSVKIATVIGFPFGYSTVSAKKEECRIAIEEGVDELDMVANIGDIKAKNVEKISKEWSEVLQVVRLHNKQLKIIVESGILSQDEIIFCCELANKHKIDFLKTSTGYASVGATVETVVTMRRHLDESIKIKASGGIRDQKTALEMIAAGAERIGASASIRIVAGG